jgi:hypothetical protein
MELTKAERDRVIREMTERVKDVVYMNAQREIEKAWSALNFDIDQVEREITVEFSVKFLIGDFTQIVGRERRKKGSK